MTIVSGGIEITSTTFCLRLGTSPRQQAPCSPLIPSNGRPSIFPLARAGSRILIIESRGKGRRNRERLSCTLRTRNTDMEGFGSARRALVSAATVTVRTAAADATASAVAGIIR